MDVAREVSLGHDKRMQGVACPGITLPQSSHTLTQSFPWASAVGGVDWWESAGCIQWDDRAASAFQDIATAQTKAAHQRSAYPCSLGDGQIFVHERGMGFGHDSRREFRLEWSGVTIGLSPRPNAARQLYNFSIQIPGHVCVVHGWEDSRDQVLLWIREWGGNLIDEWVRRLDLCLDLAGLDPDDKLFPACSAGQFLSTAKRDNISRSNDQITGYSVGQTPLRLVIYDKRAEVLQKGNEIYLRAMQQQRWNGTLPDAATRIEYQIRGPWLKDFGLKSADAVIDAFPAIMQKVTRTDSYPFFVLTDQQPDREGSHQSRCDVLPLWQQLIDEFCRLSGRPAAPLARSLRAPMVSKRCCDMAIGYLTTAAAQRSREIDSRRDLVEFFEELLTLNNVSDELLQRKFEQKARRLGNFVQMTQFPIGEYLAV